MRAWQDAPTSARITGACDLGVDAPWQVGERGYNAMRQINLVLDQQVAERLIVSPQIGRYMA